MRPLVFVLVLLAGCSSAPPLRSVDSPQALAAAQPAQAFQLDGRIAVKTPERRFSGTVAWNRSAGEDTLLLSGPLGQGAAEIRRQGGHVVLKAADGSVVAEDSDEAMLQKALGLRLPLDGLVYWLAGLPRPGAPFKAGVDGEGRIERLDQDGWHIDYGAFRRYGGDWRPGRIVARHGDDLEFRFVLDAWQPL